MIHQGGYLLLDDTFWQRQTKLSEAVAKVWSSTAGSVRLGMQVVSLVWTDGQRKIPVSMRLWQKGGKLKVELAQEILSEAAKRGIIKQARLKAKETYTVGAMQFANSDGIRFNPFQMKPKKFTICCDTPNGLACDVGGWD